MAVSQRYSPARSLVKGAAAVLHTAAATVATVALALAGDPDLVARLAVVVAGHKWALGTLGALVFAGRVLGDYRKHGRRRKRGRPA